MLKRLSHLYVMRRTWKYGRWPDKGCSLWPGVHETKEISRRYAQLIKLNCPSIQFVRFQDCAWQFIAQRDVSKINDEDVHSKFEMLELEWEEIYNIQIFAIDSVNTLSGLLLKSLDGLPETDWDELDKVHNSVEAQLAQGGDFIVLE